MIACAIGKAPNQVQRLQTAFSFPGAYAPGSPPTMESGLITPLALIRTGAGMGVTSPTTSAAGAFDADSNGSDSTAE